MAKRFYFTTMDGVDTVAEHVGNLRGARTRALEYANELGEDIFINDCTTEEIVDVVYPDDLLVKPLK